MAPAVSAEVTVSIRDFLNVRLTLDLDTMRMKRNESALLTPVLTDGTNRLQLQPVVVNGSWRHRLYLRHLHGARGPIAVQCGRHGAGQIPYADSCLYEPWMADARLILEQDNSCCGNTPAPSASRLLATNILPPHAPIDAIAPESQTAAVGIVPDNSPLPDNSQFSYLSQYSNPAPKPFHQPETKEIRITLHLEYMQFPVNSTEVLPDYSNNREELKKVTDALDSLLSAPGTKIDVVELTGYASPEGPAANNERLAFDRTVSLRDWLQRNASYRALPFSTVSGAEDWQGLRELVEKSRIPERDVLLGIIGSKKLTPEDKKECMRLVDDGRTYDLLRRDFFPQLRRTVCAIRYSRTAEGVAEDATQTIE